MGLIDIIDIQPGDTCVAAIRANTDAADGKNKVRIGKASYKDRKVNVEWMCDIVIHSADQAKHYSEIFSRMAEKLKSKDDDDG